MADETQFREIVLAQLATIANLSEELAAFLIAHNPPPAVPLDQLPPDPPPLGPAPVSMAAVVVKAVQHGLLTLSDALERYALSEEEFDLWRVAVEKHGEKALRVTTLQKYRQL
jgi:hypothetical protein